MTDRGDFGHLTLDANDMTDRQLLIVLLYEQRQTNSHLASLNGSMKDHDCKIDALTQWRNYITGGLAVLSVLVMPVVYDFVRAIIK